jgi:hypothetical protein
MPSKDLSTDSVTSNINTNVIKHNHARIFIEIAIAVCLKAGKGPILSHCRTFLQHEYSRYQYLGRRRKVIYEGGWESWKHYFVFSPVTKTMHNNAKVDLKKQKTNCLRLKPIQPSIKRFPFHRTGHILHRYTHSHTKTTSGISSQ